MNFFSDPPGGRRRPSRRDCLRAFARVGGTAAGGAALAGLLAACDRRDLGGLGGAAPSFNGVDITGAKYAQALSLTDAQGNRRSLQEFRGKVVFLFFGFTQCPDVCPTTMAELAEVRRRLGPQAEDVQGIFVTVDPERDTPEVLGEYVKALDPGFIGLRGTEEETEKAARDFKIFYQKVPAKEGPGYTMDHTAGAFVFDRQGRVRLFTRYGMGADALLADIKALLDEKAPPDGQG